MPTPDRRVRPIYSHSLLSGGPHPLEPEIIAYIRLLHEQGRTVDDIAFLSGAGHVAITYWLEERAVQL